MALVTRTAVIQARVFPPVKEASERVLSRIGLNMSEAMELFLRRVIIDERIPFEVVALDVVQLDTAKEADAGVPSSAAGSKPKRRPRMAKSFSKSFLGPTVPRQIRARKGLKRS